MQKQSCKVEIKKIVSKLINTLIPRPLLAKLFPRKYGDKTNDNIIIKIKDQIGRKVFRMLLRCDGFIENKIHACGLYGEWEKESLKIWAQLSRISNVIIDVGANTGVYSLLARNNNHRARIIAIEPVNENFDVLTQNVKANKFIIDCEKIAISDKEGVAKMFMLKGQLNYMTSIGENRYASCPEITGGAEIVEIEVPIRPFSYVHFKHKLPKIDLVKIDVEGHETTVVRSMLPYLEQYRPSILIEIIGEKNAIELDDMFRKLDYCFISIDEVNQSQVVNKLWDNHHHNFLICDKNTIQYLQSKGLVA